VKKLFCTRFFVHFFIQNHEKSPKYGWCKMKLLEIIITLKASNLFFCFFEGEMRAHKKKNAQEKAVHFCFASHVPNSNSEKKVWEILVGIKHILFNI
jgi:hypothetical protein